MSDLATIKLQIWTHRKIHRSPTLLQQEADKAGILLPINEITRAQQFLDALNKRKRRNKVILPDAHVKRYRDAKYAHQSVEFPNWVRDGHFIEPTLPPMERATDLENFIIDFLSWSGHFANRTGNEGRVIQTKGDVTNQLTGETRRVVTGTKRIPSSSKSGMQDIDTNLKHSTHRFGIPWKIEIKFGRDTHKDHQIAYGFKVQATGGVYSVVRDTTDFFEQYDNLMVGNCEQSSIFV